MFYRDKFHEHKITLSSFACAFFLLASKNGTSYLQQIPIILRQQFGRAETGSLIFCGQFPRMATYASLEFLERCSRPSFKVLRVAFLSEGLICCSINTGELRQKFEPGSFFPAEIPKCISA